MSMTKIADDRTPEQAKTYHWGVVARDRFMSGWGGARGGYSRCAWACPSFEAAEQFFKWVENRKEMSCVRVVDLRTYRAPRSTAHFYIYVAEPGHTGYPRFSQWGGESIKTPQPANAAQFDAIAAEVDA